MPASVTPSWFHAHRLFCGALCTLAACTPDLGDPASLIQAPRILAVRSEPPEAAPSEPVHLQLYAVTPEGDVTDANAEWAFCDVPKPPVENNTVSERCLTGAGRPIDGRGLSASAQIPDDACSLFGPQLPPQAADEPLRPRDADATGGYYQPVRVRFHGLTAIGLVRIRCGLASAPQDVSAAYRAQYIPNQNPGVADLRAESATGPLSWSDLPGDETLTLRLSLDESAAEPFVLFDPVDQALHTIREQLRVSWFCTDGSFSQATTAAQDDRTVSNQWRTPAQAARPTLWAVLRDSRGGVAVISRSVRVGTRDAMKESGDSGASVR